jgi:hypothetical protein
MNRRSVLVQGGLAGAGLLAAYLTWQRAPELDRGETILVDVTKNDLEKVRYENEEWKSFAELTKGKDANGPFTYLRLSGHDASDVPIPAGHPAIQVKVPERLVRGNETAQRLFERFAPLRAHRSLGQLDESQLKAFGLDTTKKRLEITWRGGKRRFAIVPAPPGGNDPYVRDEADGRVYIIARHILSDLESASTNLVERKMHPFFLEDIDKLVLSSGDKRRDLVATRNEDMPGIRIAPADKPTEFDPTLRNWHDRVWNLFPSEVLGKDEVPTSGPPEVALRIDYSSRGRPLGWVEIARAAKPAQSGVAPSNELFARTEHSAGWLRMPPDAAALLTEAENQLGKK